MIQLLLYIQYVPGRATYMHQRTHSPRSHLISSYPQRDPDITPKPCTSAHFFSWSNGGVALAESKNSRHPRPHPRHRSGNPPVVSPTRTPAISVTHVYRSSAGITNGGPRRGHAIAAPDPAVDISGATAGAPPQCRGDGQRPKHFCSCTAPTVRDPRTLSVLT